MDHRFTCGLRGQCEPDPMGNYDNKERCQVECQGAEGRDLLGIIHEYAPRATDLTPTERSELLFEITGVEIRDPKMTYDLLTAIDTDDLETMTSYGTEYLAGPLLYNYVYNHYTEDEIKLAVREVVFRAIEDGNSSQLRELIGSYPFLTEGNWMIKYALNRGHFNTLDYLLDQWGVNYHERELYRPALKNRWEPLLRWFRRNKEDLPSWLIKLVREEGLDDLLV